MIPALAQKLLGNKMRRILVLTACLCAVASWNCRGVRGQEPIPAPRADSASIVERVELFVKEIVEAVKKSYKEHSSVETCTRKITCNSYRLDCHPLPLEEDSLCLRVSNQNRLFDRRPCSNQEESGRSCSKVEFYTKSYVRVPWWSDEEFHKYRLEQMLNTTLDRMNCDQALTICSLLDLDQIFADFYQENSPGSLENLGRSWFGASNGIFRIYPGLEQKCTIPYDPRKRAWYKVFTSVRKEVTILIDTGTSTTDRVRGKDGSDETVLKATKNIVKRYLDTANKDDEIFLYKFDELGTSLISESIYVETDNSTRLEADLEPWKRDIDEIHAGKLDGNLTQALETVLLERYPTSSTSTREGTLKILIIVASERLSMDLTPESPIVRALQARGIRVFIVQWEPLRENDESFSDLSETACVMNASYTRIDRSSILSDHLSSLRSFFSYLANIRFAVAGKNPIWVSSYDSNSFGPLLSVVYPAFDEEGELLGVASVSIPVTAKHVSETKDRGGHDRTESGVEFASSLDCKAKMSYAVQPGQCSPSVKCDRRVMEGVQLSDESHHERICCDDQCSFSIGPNKAFNSVPVIASVAAAGGLLLLCAALGFLFRGRLRRLLTKGEQSPSGEDSGRERYVQAPNVSPVGSSSPRLRELSNHDRETEWASHSNALRGSRGHSSNFSFLDPL